MTHAITRVRHELRRRTLTVVAVDRLTSSMVRITLGGDDLADFTSLAPDDHVKLFVPTATGEPARRDFTPRRFDAAAQTLAIDFALHEAGPASDWARHAAPGQAIDVGGPRASLIVPDSFDWWLLVADEAGIPAVARRLEELPDGKKAICFLIATGPAEHLPLDTRAELHAIWIHRPAASADDPAPILAQLREIPLPDGDGFAFVAAEATVARAVRDHLATERGHPSAWIRAAGYWKKGETDAHVTFDD